MRRKRSGTGIGLVVKRRGHREAFDGRKLYGSIYAACASAHYPERRCEKIADLVSRKVQTALGKGRTVNSLAIRKLVEKELKRLDQGLHFYYEQHLPDLRRL